MSIKEFFSGAIKDAPVVGIGAAKVFGVTLDTWLWFFGALYIIGRAIWFGVECYWKWKDRRVARK